MICNNMIRHTRSEWMRARYGALFSCQRQGAGHWENIHDGRIEMIGGARAPG